MTVKPKPRRSAKQARIVSIGPRLQIAQMRLLEIVVIEQLLSERREKIRIEMLAGAVVARGPLKAHLEGVRGKVLVIT